jgi:transcription elongation factor Elf1
VNDWRTCPACGKDYALTFAVDKDTKVRTMKCRHCPHVQTVKPLAPKEKAAA